LGVTVQDGVILLSKEFLKLVLISLVLASPIAWYFMSQWLHDFYYRIDIAWWIFALASLLTLLLAFITVSLLAVKAGLANPMENLRTE
jgi:putative ABC transport system permease protein